MGEETGCAMSKTRCGAFLKADNGSGVNMRSHIRDCDECQIILQKEEEAFDKEQAEPSIAEQTLGRPIYQETREQDEREIRRIYNRKED